MSDVGGDIAAGCRLPVPIWPHGKEEGPGDDLDEDLQLVSQIGGLRVRSARAQAATTKLSAVLAECRERTEHEQARKRVVKLNRLKALARWLEPPAAVAGGFCFAAWRQHVQMLRADDRERRSQHALEHARGRETEVHSAMARRDAELVWLRGRVVAERCARRTHQLCALANNPASPIEHLAEAMRSRVGAGLAAAEAFVLCFAIWRRCAVVSKTDRESRAVASAVAEEAAASASTSAASRAAARVRNVAVASMVRSSSSGLLRRCTLSWRRRAATVAATLSAQSMSQKEALASLAHAALSAWRFSALTTRCGRYVAQEQQAAAAECLVVQEQLDAQREEGAAARRGFVTMEQKVHIVRHRALSLGVHVITHQSRRRSATIIHVWRALAARSASDRNLQTVVTELRRHNAAAMARLTSKALRERVRLVLHSWRQWQERQRVCRWHDELGESLNKQLGEQQEQIRHVTVAISNARSTLVESRARESDRVRLHRAFFAFSQHCFCERAARQTLGLEGLAAAAMTTATVGRETPRSVLSVHGDDAGASCVSAAQGLSPVAHSGSLSLDMSMLTLAKLPRLRCEQYLYAVQSRLLTIEVRHAAYECFHRWHRECQLNQLADVRLDDRERRATITSWVISRFDKAKGLFLRCFSTWRITTVVERAELWRRMDRLDARGRREHLSAIMGIVHTRLLARCCLGVCWFTWCQHVAASNSGRQLVDIEKHCEEITQRLEAEQGKAQFRASGRAVRAAALGRFSRHADDAQLALRCISAWRICALVARVDVCLRGSRSESRGLCDRFSLLVSQVYIRHSERCLLLCCCFVWIQHLFVTHADRQFKDLEIHCDELNEMLEVERHERQKAFEQASGRQRGATDLEAALQHEADVLRQRHAEMRARSDRLNRELFAVTAAQSSIVAELEDRSFASEGPTSDTSIHHMNQRAGTEDCVPDEPWGLQGQGQSQSNSVVVNPLRHGLHEGFEVGRVAHENKTRRRVSFDLDTAEIIRESDGTAAEHFDASGDGSSQASDTPLHSSVPQDFRREATQAPAAPPLPLPSRQGEAYEEQLRNFERMLADSASYEEDARDDQDESCRHSWSAGDDVPTGMLDVVEQEEPVRHEVRVLRTDVSEFGAYDLSSVSAHDVSSLSADSPLGSGSMASSADAAAAAAAAATSCGMDAATQAQAPRRLFGNGFAVAPSDVDSDPPLALPAAPQALATATYPLRDLGTMAPHSSGRSFHRTPLSSEASFDGTDSPLPLPVSLQLLWLLQLLDCHTHTVQGHFRHS